MARRFAGAGFSRAGTGNARPRLPVGAGRVRRRRVSRVLDPVVDGREVRGRVADVAQAQGFRALVREMRVHGFRSVPQGEAAPGQPWLSTLSRTAGNLRRVDLARRVGRFSVRWHGMRATTASARSSDRATRTTTTTPAWPTAPASSGPRRTAASEAAQGSAVVLDPVQDGQEVRGRRRWASVRWRGKRLHGFWSAGLRKVRHKGQPSCSIRSRTARKFAGGSPMSRRRARRYCGDRRLVAAARTTARACSWWPAFQ